MFPSSPSQLLVILLKANKIFRWDLNFPMIWGGGEEVGVVIMGCRQGKSFV